VKTLASFLKRIVQRLNAGEKRGSSWKTFTAVFGKHPGWDDHIDDIGLDTHVLIAVKRSTLAPGRSLNASSKRRSSGTSSYG